MVDWKLLLNVTTSIKIVANAATTGLQTAKPVGDSGDHSNLPIPPINVNTGGTGIGRHFSSGSSDGGTYGGSDGGIIGIAYTHCNWKHFYITFAFIAFKADSLQHNNQPRERR